jgi:hypothetical protein
MRTAQPGNVMPVNEAMCGIGAFIERNEHQYLVIKNVTPDGPASRNPDLFPGNLAFVCACLREREVPMHVSSSSMMFPPVCEAYPCKLLF